MPLSQSGFRLSLLPIPQHSFQRPYRPLSLRRLGTRLLAAFQPSRLAPPGGPTRLEPLERKHLLELDRPLELLGRVPEKAAECAPAAPSIRLSSARGIAQTVSKTACLAAFLGGRRKLSLWTISGGASAGAAAGPQRRTQCGRPQLPERSRRLHRQRGGRARIHPFVNAAYACVVPSRREGFPIASLEPMARGPFGRRCFGRRRPRYFRYGRGNAAA